MRDLDNSLHINFSRLNSIQWNQLDGQISQDASNLNRPREYTNSFLLSMPNEPPRPGNSLYSCIESEQSENSDIKEVPFVAAESEAKVIKHVNSKQYFRMMKRRIKKGMEKILKGDDPSETKSKRKKYMHESRHKHATSRPRGKDGKFLATRPVEQRFREKKKRGRKPKSEKQQKTEAIQSSTKNEQSDKTP